ncbi:GerMN domain-containing protein [Patescibacteria group bacterium]|nr:GerMN domain-containing protein [Patescibacteria group bacterium]MBU4512684.1 GerMN domain-containing protein [Patescibacteria group bacterium]MCG2693586.1 GerMN domain-containing protein [Candidatus Parcubacteria bacterium]
MKKIIFLTILVFSLVLSGCILENIEVNEDKGQPVAGDEQEDEMVDTEEPQDEEDDMTTEIKVYFIDKQVAVERDCATVVEFAREIPSTEAIGAAAVNEMIKGPSMKEEGVASNAVPTGTKLLSLEIRDGAAYAHFSKELQNYGGGSCAVSAIRAQIESTLKQFPTVDSVVISVEGVLQEEVLQP